MSSSAEPPSDEELVRRAIEASMETFRRENNRQTRRQVRDLWEYTRNGLSKGIVGVLGEAILAEIDLRSLAEP